MNKSYGRLDDHATINSLFHAHDAYYAIVLFTVLVVKKHSYFTLCSLLQFRAPLALCFI